MITFIGEVNCSNGIIVINQSKTGCRNLQAAILWNKFWAK